MLNKTALLVVTILTLSFPAGVGLQAMRQGYPTLRQDIKDAEYALDITGQVIQAEEIVRHTQLKKLSACVQYIQDNLSNAK